ncbi:MAG: hypothetical protein GF365_00885 [Candidatus Buchananbacteria bacterium]|nr:hypothetical protein [Candidatus Buchananbacteria bacterium]
MKKIYIPINLPLGLHNDIKDWSSKKISIDINSLRDLSKHKSTNLDFLLSIIKGHPEFDKSETLEHKGLLISPELVIQYKDRQAKENHKFTLEIKIITDIELISKQYSAPKDIYEDIIYSLCLFLNASLNTLTFARFSPIIFDDKKVIFNSKLAYLINPWQDWFRSYDTLQIILNDSLKNQINSTAKNYDLMLPHVKESIKPLDLNKLSDLADVDMRVTNYLHRFGRVLSEIIRMHPSHDYSAIIGLLTALIEGFLLINGENRYKFKIRVSNLLNDNNIGSALTNIYDSRSIFFHSGKYSKIDDIFDFLTIEFLLVILQKIINFQIKTEIKQDSFDYTRIP